MRQIIKNGTIVTGGGSFPADILIDGEKIAATGTAANTAGGQGDRCCRMPDLPRIH